MYRGGFHCILSSFMLALLIFPSSSRGFVPASASSQNTRTIPAGSSSRLYAEKPFAVIVKAEIKPERMDEFLELIEKNAIATRKEPGCIRFDVLRSKDNPNEFFFYELYQNAAAIDYHKTQDHYNLWADFKASGGTVDSVTFKTDGEFLT